MLFPVVEVTISLSNLFKQCFVVNSAEGKRIINSNKRMEECLSQIGTSAHVPQGESIELSSEGSDEDAVNAYEEEKAKLETLRKEMIAHAQTMANQITATAQSEANGIMYAAKTQAQELFEEQKKLGYEEGQRQSELEKKELFEQLEQDFLQKKKQLESDYENRMEHMESDIVDAVVQVFEKVFQIQFSDKRTMLLALVKNTLMDVDAGNKVRIHVNEADHQMLLEHLEEIQKQLGSDVSIEFVQENKFVDGQCQIETSYGVFDCGLDTQFTNLIKDIRSLVE